ncbi:MAG: serine hydrolase domain-containing protein, partial [Planctomycetota bacterium]
MRAISIAALIAVLALVCEPQLDSAERIRRKESITCAENPRSNLSDMVCLLTPETSREQESANEDADYSREFRAAMAAHHLCAGLWVVGRSYQRTPEEVLAQDIAPFRVFGWEEDFEYEVDWDHRTVTVRGLGIPPRTAKYNGDQGCTILPRGASDVYFKPVLVPRNLPDPATQPWPMGDAGATVPIPDGVDAEAIATVLDWAMTQEEQNTRAIVVAYGGKIVGERYATGWTKDTPQISWSQGKSITSALIGVLVQQQRLRIDDSAPVKAWQGDADPRRQIRISDLLRMSSGLGFVNLGLSGPQAFTSRSEHMRIYFDALNVFKHATTQPLESPPNTEWRYRNSDPLALGRIVRDTVEAHGNDYLTFPQRALFDRIGARNFVLETDAWGNFILTGYDYGSARDWVRFGLLHLWDGVWQGKRILPEGWVEFISTPAPADSSRRYGGLFWLNRGGALDRVPKDAFWAAGFMGQITMVIPSRDVVVVRLGPSPRGFNQYLNELVG